MISYIPLPLQFISPCFRCTDIISALLLILSRMLARWSSLEKISILAVAGEDLLAEKFSKINVTNS